METSKDPMAIEKKDCIKASLACITNHQENANAKEQEGRIKKISKEINIFSAKLNQANLRTAEKLVKEYKLALMTECYRIQLDGAHTYSDSTELASNNNESATITTKTGNAPENKSDGSIIIDFGEVMETEKEDSQLDVKQLSLSGSFGSFSTSFSFLLESECTYNDIFEG